MVNNPSNALRVISGGSTGKFRGIESPLVEAGTKHRALFKRHV